MNMDLQINFVYLKIHSQKIVDFLENGKPISIINNAAYTKTINETKIINTLPHDSQSILPSIKNINTKKQYNLVGDAGFIIDTNKIPKNVNLITAKRKNQHKKNTTDEKLILKKRYIIENVFAKIKKFNRIHIRRDKLIVSYMGFVHIALMKIL